ncbi:GNAT family N-acetyltransferase, partial [Candidatus Bathyarchaeota archaeon]|nr:GNAT family N-acetyltransferase [Candidatus Bathyarchaeota archaeon]
MREALRVAEQLGCRKVVLNITEGNERAMRLYRRFGFKIDAYETDSPLHRRFLEEGVLHEPPAHTLRAKNRPGTDGSSIGTEEGHPKNRRQHPCQAVNGPGLGRTK